MSRLLERLASQALGVGGPRVRSASAVHAQTPLALPVRERVPAPDASSVFDAAAIPAGPHTRPHRRHDVAAISVEPRTTPQRRHAAAAVPAEPHTRLHHRHDAPAPRAPERLEAHVDRVLRDEAARPLADTILDERAARDAVAPSSDPLQPPTDARVVHAALPTPLLGEFVSTPAAAAATSTIRPTAPQDATNLRADAEPTEVHVHIGRIEVTAVYPPAATPLRRRDRPPRQTLPLSDYLAKRGSS